MKTKLNIEIEEIAEALASSSDIEMGQFFNFFFKGLRINCESDYRFDMQLHAIESRLSSRAKNAMKLITFED